MFHAHEAPVTNPSSSSIKNDENRIKLPQALAVVFALVLLLLGLWNFGIFLSDPYIKATLSLEGSLEKGERLFRVNCVGCHGISAQGLLGPDLHAVSNHLSEKQIINQVKQGRTPPMPSFQMEPQQMADLLVYLKSLN